jgi:hypothetical protein
VTSILTRHKMPNIYNVVTDVNQTVLVNNELIYKVEYRRNGRYVVYLGHRDAQQTAKLEFIIYEDPNTPDETDVTGSILRYGTLNRNVVSTVMSAIMERL